MNRKKKKSKELVTTIPQLAKMMRDSFQSHQDLILGEVGTLKGEVGNLRKEMKSGFRQVTEKINNLSRNTVDVIHQEEFDKLETRVTDVEEVLHLTSKK